MLYYRQLIILIIITLLTACAVGPDYVRPKALTLSTIPTHFKEGNGKVVTLEKYKAWKPVCPADSASRGEWWRIFHDAKLNQLENALNEGNQNIINADQNYRQARAMVDEARANYYPTLSSALTLTHQKQSGGSTAFISTNSTGATTTGTASNVGAGGSSVNSTHSLGLSASWVPDIWGQTRRTVEAASANAQASSALLAATRLAQQSALAQYYFELRGLDLDQKILNDTVRGYQATLNLTLNQYHSGVIARADVIQAQTQVDTARVQATNNGILRAQYEHAIAVLIGLPPEKLNLAYAPSRATPPRMPIEVPSSLLERRPDVAQAERLMVQANAQVGEAIAAYFPTITLSGTASTANRSAALADLFSVPGLSWAFGPQLSQLIFDGGLRSATVAAARHGYRATVASYRQTVLAAFQNVEDNLVSLRLLADEAVQQNAAAANAVYALKLVVNQYKAGTVPYASVITAQIAAYTAQKMAADIAYARMVAAVGLIAALGGGWDAASIAHAGG